jgi:uncharacterized membrane protein YdjX (TVP38/TMEM64 family)
MSVSLRWIALVVVVLALILVPFAIWGEQVEAWTHHFIESAGDNAGWVMVVLGGLLALDILLPVPSSLVSTACGFLLGFMPGMLTSLAGMIISNALGFTMGAQLGRPFAHKLVGKAELQRLEQLSQQLGDWAIIVARPVPVLAEASVLFAGMGRMSMPRFMILSGLASLGISLVYAAVGAFSATEGSFLLAFAGAILVPGLAMLVFRKRDPAS